MATYWDLVIATFMIINVLFIFKYFPITSFEEKLYNYSTVFTLVLFIFSGRALYSSNRTPFFKPIIDRYMLSILIN